MLSRLILAAALAGCASAGAPDTVPATPDASGGGGGGGNGSGSQHPDAGTGTQHADAATQHPDAPTQTGTCATPMSGVLATWSFAGATGSQTSTTSSSTSGGTSAGAVTRSSALTAVSGANSINASNWGSAATADTTKYFAFSITPPAGCTLSITSVAIDAKSSATGPTAGAIATSADNYVSTQTVSTAAPGTVTMSVNGATAKVELRVYGWSASSTSGTLRIQNTLSITGSLQ